MNTQTRQGFTIIETVLFLGVTGLMIASMFIGIGSTIGAQRYRDSVESFKSAIQQQYAEISSVENSREGLWVCTVGSGNLTAIQDDAGSANGAHRGQGGCDIVGKYMTVIGGDIRTYTILAHKNATPSVTAVTDIDKLSANYTLGTLASGPVSTNQLEWGTKLAWPKGSASPERNGERSIGILFLRSPDSGSIYTFTSDAATAQIPRGDQLEEMIVAGNAVPGRQQRLLCVDPDGVVLTPTRGIYIDANAAGSSAVRVNVDGDFTGAESC